MKTEQLTAESGFQVPGLNAVEGEGTVVLMAHGFGSEKRGHTPLFMTEGLKAAGFGVYGFDFPAHGDSPPHRRPADHGALPGQLRSGGGPGAGTGPDAEIVYFGSSFGAYTVLLYLATRPHWGGKPICALPPSTCPV